MSKESELATSILRACKIKSNGKKKSDYLEIIELAEMLAKAGIPFQFGELNGGYQIRYPNKEKQVCSVVEHSFSYGSDNDLLEIMGLLTEEEQKEDVGDESAVKGYLTAEEVFKRIEKHFAENK